MTFSKQLSQRLQEIGIDIPPTGLWWVQDITHGEWRLKTGKKSGSDWEESYPALSLSNLLCLLPVIFEAMKWNEENIAHKITDIFLSKSEEQAYKLASEYLLKLIK